MTRSRMSRRTMLKGATALAAVVRASGELLAQQAGKEQQRSARPVTRHNVLGLPGGVAGDEDDTADGLAAATSVPAAVFHLNDRGRIAPGLRADLLLVRGDPTQEITATRNIVAVWKCGVSEHRPRLDR